MNESIVVGLLQNIAILLSFALLYDYIWVKEKTKQTIWNKVITGLIIGGVGLLLMLTPWTLAPGLVFDSRSIMLAISGLFFGPIPTIIAMLVTASYRVFLGGGGMLMGITVIAVSGTTGILWNVFRRKSRRSIRLIDLYLLGITVHLLMLACVIFLPAKLQLTTLEDILPTVLIIYPLGTILLGYLMVNRIHHWDTKKALRNSEERFKMLFDKAPIGYQSLDENGHFIEVNQTWLDLLGYSREEVLGKWFGDFLAPKFVEPFRKRFPLFKELGKIHSEFEMMKKDGTIIVSSFEGLIGYTSTNKFKQTHCVLTDITERRKAANALMESEEKYRRITENANDIIFRYDLLPYMRLTYINKAVANITGYTPVECLADTQLMFSLIHPGDKPIMQQYVETLQSPQEPFILRWLDKSGNFLWMETHSVPVYDNDGNMIAVEGITRDVTSEKQSKDALKASEEKYRLLHEHAGVGIGYYSPEGTVLSFNELAASNMGGKREDFVGKSIYDMFSIEEADFYMNRIKLVIDSDEISEYEDMLTLPTGNFWFLSIFSRVQDIDGKVIGVQIISQNITGRKEAEHKLEHKINELQRFNDLTVNRELKMVDLKKEINDLHRRLGENEKYNIVK
ncbi:MAG: PAS domain S-box protein [bacterium]